ncbi:hypothetical protein [Oceanobacillus sp. FSL H7-0719]|uniref:hypothetical protein n=1 Tax=Oceanobacillus sp. FSL H7-0719 TaxID=2954507 RepID=UPI00324C9F83
MDRIRDVCEKLWHIEKDFDLFSIEIRDIKVWEIIRFSVFNEITNKLGFYGKAHSESSKSITSQIKRSLMILGNSIKKNPFRSIYKGSTLVLDHPRKVKNNGKFIDIYTEAFITDMNLNDFFVLEYPYLGKHYSDLSDANRSYMDFFYIYTLYMIPLKLFKFTQEDLQIIFKIEEILKDAFGVKIQLRKLIYKRILTFELKYSFFNMLIKRKKLKKVFLVVSYTNFPLVAAAKDNNIVVSEIQHGVITDYHFAYNFGNPSIKLKYFPDKLLTFGEYWGKTEKFPQQAKVVVNGFPYLNKQLEKYKDIPKKKNQILFISQGTIGRELSRKANEIAEIMYDYKIIYKLHPGEYDRWRKDYPELVAASKLNNVEIIDSNEKNLYSLFAESEYQIGVYSTAIFEGLTLGCKTLLFNLPGIEYMEDLIKQNIVKLVHNNEEMVKMIDTYDANQFPRDYFFKE